MASRSDVTEAMKYTYASDRIERYLNETNSTWRILSKKMQRVGGRSFLQPIQTQLPEAFVGVTEGGTIPTPLDPATTEASYTLHEFAGAFRVTWRLMSDMQDDKMAFKRALKLLDEGIRVAISQDLSNELLGDGTGALAYLPAADNTSPVTVSRPIKCRRGMVVDIMDTDHDTKHLDSGTISAVDTVNNTVATSGTITSTGALDFFVREDTCDDSVNDCLHLNGLTGIVNSADPPALVGDYGGIDRGTAGNEFWESVMLANGGTNRSLVVDLLLQCQHDMRLKGGGKLNKILTAPPLFRRYFESVAQSGYFHFSNSGGLKGDIGPSNFTGMDEKTGYKFGGVEWCIDDFAPANTMFLLDTSTFFIAHGKNKVPQPVADVFDRANYFVDTTRTDFDVRFWWLGELVCTNPSGNGRINDLAES